MKKSFRVLSIIGLLFIWFVSFSIPIVSQGTTNTFLPIISNNYDLNWIWEDIELVNLIPTPGSDPYLISDHTGRTHIFWDTFSKPSFIYHTYQTDSGWSEPQPVAETLGSSQLLLQPLLTPDGVIHLLWYNTLSSGSYRLLYAEYDGNHWSPEEVITELTQPYPSARMNFDNVNNIHVVYRIPGIIYSSWYSRIRTQSGWGISELIEPYRPPGMAPGFTNWPDRLGGVRVYGDAIYDVMYYFYWKDGSFIGDYIEFNGNISGSTILDAQNNLQIYWDGNVPIPGGNVTGLYHQCLDPGLNWNSPVALSGYDSVGYGSRASWDGHQRMVFGWKTYDSMELEMVILTNCQESQRSIATLPVLPGINSWGNLSAVGLTPQPNKVCALIDIPFSSNTYGILCGNLNW